jgi:hypothetical protein
MRATTSTSPRCGRTEPKSLGLLLAALVIGACGDDEEEPGSCGLSWSFSQPAVPSCDEIHGRIAEVSVERWSDEAAALPQDAVFVSQPHCGDHANGSADAPYCWVDNALDAAVQGEQVSVYLDPGEYSIMGEAACDPDGKLDVALHGAGAGSTRLHLTCTPTQGSWSLSDLTLAAETVQVPQNRKLALERVVEQILSGSAFLDVQGEIRLTDVVVALESPVGAEPVVVDDSSHQVNDITGSSVEASVAIRLSDGAAGVATGLCVSEAAGVGILLTGSGTKLDIRDSVVQRSQGDPYYGLGYGVSVEQGAALRAQGLLIDANRDVGLLVHDGATATLEASVLQATSHVVAYAGGMGLVAQVGAQVDVSESLVVGNLGPGAVVTTGAELLVKGSEFTDNGFAGVAVLGGSVEVADSSLSANVASSTSGGGVGLFAHELVEEHPVQLVVERTVMEGQAWQLYLRGQPGRTTGTLVGNCFGGSTMEPWAGSVLIVETDEAVVLQDNHFDGALQLVLDLGTVSLQGNSYAAVTDGVTIQQQRCDAVTPVDVSQENLPDPDGLAICDGPAMGVDPYLQYLLALAEVGVESR